MNLILITAPTQEPVSVAEVKAQARIEQTDEDELIDDYITSARQRLEETECWIQLMTATYEMQLDYFPDGDDTIKLPRPPLTSVSSIKYIDTSGTEQTLATSVYTVDAKSLHVPQRAEVFLAYNQVWPSTRNIRNAVKIRYICGFGDDPENVPDALKSWISATVAAMFENREAVFVGQGYTVLNLGFIDGLLDPYRVKSYF